MKKIWIDTETTGLNPHLHEIIQIAGLIDIDGSIKEEFCFYIKPEKQDNIDAKALKVNNFTCEQLKNFPSKQTEVLKIIDICKKYININNKYDRLIPAGHNVMFDIEFLKYNFYGVEAISSLKNLLHYNCLDLMTLVLTVQDLGVYKGKSTRLVDVCRCFEVDLEKAHDALSDIKATRECYYKIINRIYNYNTSLEEPNIKNLTLNRGKIKWH